MATQVVASRVVLSSTLLVSKLGWPHNIFLIQVQGIVFRSISASKEGDDVKSGICSSVLSRTLIEFSWVL
jgi:hypothetical protein